MKYIKTYEQYSHSELTEEGWKSLVPGTALALSTLFSSPEATAQTKSPIGHEQTVKATKDSEVIKTQGPNGEEIKFRTIQFSKENPGFNKIDTSGNISTPKIYSDYEHHMVKPVIGSAHGKGLIKSANSDEFIKFNYTTKVAIKDIKKDIKLIQETSFVDNEGTNMIFYEIVIEEDSKAIKTETSTDIEFNINKLKQDAIYHIKCGNDAIKFQVFAPYP